ncbi:thioredoxin domain-containing protein [Niabella hibiscisoli]|uniref:hypothetical protein n=1 Tax=Niabella hibiscisoli TaxID=1825928 RepID=UPI001F0E59E7|nr:hypothetical protein [Niabella hibiscisoli]MCH5715996.1 hypothetical protein [Niabella hibiscisoli]
MKNKLIAILIFVAPLLNAQSSSQPPNIEQTVLPNNTLLINALFEKGYNKWNKDSLVNIMLPAVWKEQDSIVATNPQESKIIRYYYARKLFTFSDGIKNNMSKNSAWKTIADTSFSKVSLPDTSILSSSASANQYVSNFVANELLNLFLNARRDGELIIQQTLDLPIDSLRKVAEKYGETFLTILYARKILPPLLHEHYLTRQLSSKVESKDLMTSVAIYQELKNQYPQSQWLAFYERQLNQLDIINKQNKNDKDIVFIQHADSITSLKKLISPFKGKVVYLDIWGSWCGPCLSEIAYHTKPLKNILKMRINWFTCTSLWKNLQILINGKS